MAISISHFYIFECRSFTDVTYAGHLDVNKILVANTLLKWMKVVKEALVSLDMHTNISDNISSFYMNPSSHNPRPIVED